MRSDTCFVMYLVVLLAIVCVGAQDLSEDGKLNFKEIAVKYGFDCEEHDVVTEDGYVLKMFHVLGDVTRPVLLIHGILDSSDSFMTRGNGSLTARLVREGYDVWVGNKRGNRYSRRHVMLDPDRDKEFWNYSFHENGIYDMPALIDHVLSYTGQSQLTCMGHSQGNTVFYVLGSMRPEYNKKIKLLVALAPVSYLYHLKGLVRLTLHLWPFVSAFLALLGIEEVFGWKSLENTILRCVCVHEIGYDLCVKRLMMPFAGEDIDELEPEFVKTAVGHYFAGTSRKSGSHLAQCGLKNRFAQMDYGVMRNLELYNSTTPPSYDLRKVTMRVALVAGANDEMSPLKDVRTLRRRLPNVVDYKVLEHRKMNHIDFVWGRNMDKYLYPHIVSLLRTYN
jgi:lysosomal acid lipase/cholesteryl ester hydrolase